jgi:hypothetical protein
LGVGVGTRLRGLAMVKAKRVVAARTAVICILIR